jgi:putative endonuclease
MSFPRKQVQPAGKCHSRESGNPVLRRFMDTCLHRYDKRQREIMNQYYVYILANKRNGTLYIGVTNDLIRRVYEHKNNLIDGFSKKYTVHLLVYFEIQNDIYHAIEREKQLKKWQRNWKIELIEKDNPEWIDLYDGLI